MKDCGNVRAQRSGGKALLRTKVLIYGLPFLFLSFIFSFYFEIGFVNFLSCAANS